MNNGNFKTCARGHFYISTRTFIVVATTSYRILRRFRLVANNVSINAFYYVLTFLHC